MLSKSVTTSVLLVIVTILILAAYFLPAPYYSEAANYTVSGFVFKDNNRDGDYNSGDEPFSGRTVRLTSRNGGRVYDQSTTGADGSYSVSGPDGPLRITHDIPSGYERTNDDSTPFNLTGNWDGKNFGVAQIGSSFDDGGPDDFTVRGIVFVDNNRDGGYNSGDDPYPNSTVYLVNESDTFEYDTDQTNSSGNYEVEGPAGETVRIRHNVPSGYERTTDDSVVLGNLNSDQTRNFGIYRTPPPPPPPPTVTISCTPGTVPYNGSATVTWSSENTASCSVSPTGWTGPSGSKSTGNLTSSQTYTVTCTGL